MITFWNFFFIALGFLSFFAIIGAILVTILFKFAERIPVFIDIFVASIYLLVFFGSMIFGCYTIHQNNLSQALKLVQNLPEQRSDIKYIHIDCDCNNGFFSIGNPPPRQLEINVFHSEISEGSYIQEANIQYWDDHQGLHQVVAPVVVEKDLGSSENPYISYKYLNTQILWITDPELIGIVVHEPKN